MTRLCWVYQHSAAVARRGIRGDQPTKHEHCDSEGHTDAEAYEKSGK